MSIENMEQKQEVFDNKDDLKMTLEETQKQIDALEQKLSTIVYNVEDANSVQQKKLGEAELEKLKELKHTLVQNIV